MRLPIIERSAYDTAVILSHLQIKCCRESLFINTGRIVMFFFENNNDENKVTKLLDTIFIRAREDKDQLLPSNNNTKRLIQTFPTIDTMLNLLKSAQNGHETVLDRFNHLKTQFDPDKNNNTELLKQAVDDFKRAFATLTDSEQKQISNYKTHISKTTFKELLDSLKTNNYNKESCKCFYFALVYVLKNNAAFLDDTEFLLTAEYYSALDLATELKKSFNASNHNGQDSSPAQNVPPKTVLVSNTDVTNISETPASVSQQQKDTAPKHHRHHHHHHRHHHRQEEEQQQPRHRQLKNS